MAKIMIIDDSDTILSMLSRVLEGAGHQALACNSGREALRRLIHAPVDVVLTDIYMPDMDGFEVILELRRRHPSIPVIGMSANPAPFDALKVASDMGAAWAIAKPFSCEILLEAVEGAVAGRWQEERRRSFQEAPAITAGLN